MTSTPLPSLPPIPLVTNGDFFNLFVSLKKKRESITKTWDRIANNRQLWLVGIWVSASLAQVHQLDFTPRSGLRPLQAPRILSSPLPSKEKMQRENIQLGFFFFFFDFLQFFFLPIFMYMVPYYIRLMTKTMTISWSKRIGCGFIFSRMSVLSP